LAVERRERWILRRFHKFAPAGGEEEKRNTEEETSVIGY